MGFPRGSVVKNPPASAGDAGSVSRLGRSPGGGDGNPCQYSCLENPMDRGAWRAAVQRVGRDLATKQQLFCNVFFYPLATHSSILAWKIPWTEEPGRPQSIGSQRVGHNWVTSLHFLPSGCASQETVHITSGFPVTFLQVQEAKTTSCVTFFPTISSGH